MPLVTSGRVSGSGRRSSGIGSRRLGAKPACARRASPGPGARSPTLGSGARPYGSGQAVMQRPQPSSSSRSRTTGISPVWGLISVPSWMQCLAQASMQRPQPLQYSGSRKGLGFSAVVDMRRSPFGVQSVQTPRQAPHAIHQWHRRHDASIGAQFLRPSSEADGRYALSTTCPDPWSDQGPRIRAPPELQRSVKPAFLHVPRVAADEHLERPRLGLPLAGRGVEGQVGRPSA